MLGKIEGRRRRGRQRMRWLDGITNLMDTSFEQVLGLGDGQGGLACFSAWECKYLDTTKRLNWTELNWTFFYILDWQKFKFYSVFCWEGCGETCFHALLMGMQNINSIDAIKCNLAIDSIYCLTQQFTSKNSSHICSSKKAKWCLHKAIQWNSVI